MMEKKNVGRKKLVMVGAPALLWWSLKTDLLRIRRKRVTLDMRRISWV